jgi:phenylalanine-4-hydroxylase
MLPEPASVETRVVSPQVIARNRLLPKSFNIRMADEVSEALMQPDFIHNLLLRAPLLAGPIQ